MDRRELAHTTHNRSHLLTLGNDDYMQWVIKYTLDEFEKDGEDITSLLCVDSSVVVEAEIRAQAHSIVAGIQELKFFIEEFSDLVAAEFLKSDGDLVNSSDVICVLKGSARSILKIERIALNLLQRMSGVARFTSELVEMMGSDSPLLCATRKTLWGLLDKRAVSLGGGGTHRLSLKDALLVKDTHLDLMKLNFKRLFELFLKEKSQAAFFEVEVESRSALDSLLNQYVLIKGNLDMPFVVMLDNFTAKEIQKTLQEVRSNSDFDGVLFEASGGIKKENLLEYAQSGVDIISMGALTMDAPVSPFHLKVV